MKTLTDELIEVADVVIDLAKQETKGEEQDLSYEQAEEILKELKKNTPEFTTLKLIEELAELQEKLIKFHLKAPSHKPKLEEILDEIGDVGIRATLFLEHHSTEDFDAQEYVDDRVEKKMKKLYGYYKEGKYKGGL